MNNYAVIKLGASQQKVSVGDLVVTDKMTNEVGDKVTVSEVYLLTDGENIAVGTPTLDTKVELEVVSHGKGKKVKIHKFKAKSRYKKTNGYRASLTTLKVLSIGEKKVKKSEEPVKAAKKTTAKKSTVKKTAKTTK